MKRIFLLILIGICLGMYVSAQSLDFYNSFVDDQSNFDPELLMLEPHYNADGTIAFYTMANLLKVEYERNEKGQPIRKTMSVFDKYDYDWNKMFVTNYEYKDGRLVREILSSQKGLGWNKPIIDKRISYDPDTNTDTIRVENNIALMYSGFSGTEDTESYSVRYYNKENTRIDSVLQVSIYIYDSYDSQDSLYTEKNILKQKVTYEYDKSGRVKEAKSDRQFYDNEEKRFSDWKEVYSFDVNYKKNETEYVQRATYLYRDEDEDYWGSYKERTDITRFSIVSDDKGRITRKQVIIDKDLILDAQYTYDDKGRLSVLHEQNVTDRFMEMFGLMGLNSQMMRQLGDISYLKYTLRQVGNCEETEVYLKEDDNIQKVGELKFCKLDDERPSLIEIKKYDEGVLDDYEKMVFNYKEDGSVEKTEYNYVYDYTDDDTDTNTNTNTNTKILIPYKKTIVQKDDNGQTIYEEFARFDDETKKWKNNSKEIYEYNEEGLLIHEERYTYGSFDSYYWSPQSHSFKGDTWIGEKWVEQKYDDNKNVIEYLKKSWDGEKWINHSWAKYSFDDSKNRTHVEEYRWGEEIEYWEGYNRDSTVYNSRGEEICRIYYEWLSEQKKWKLADKVESDKTEIEREEQEKSGYYSEHNEIHSEWKDNKWLPTLKIQYRRGNINNSDLKWKWDVDKKDWYLSMRSIFEEEGNVSYSEYTRWDDDCNCLEGIENTTTISLNDNDKQFIHRVWDYKASTWKDTISVFELHDYSRSLMTHIYELYNEDSHSWVPNRKVLSEITDNKNGIETTTQVQSLWDNKEKKWIPSVKLHYSYNEDKKEDAITEVDKYNITAQTWEKAYRSENIKIKKKRRDVKIVLYSGWNKDKKAWKPICAEDSYSWNTPYYKWDAVKEKLVPAVYSEIEEIKAKIEKAFDTINTDTKYSELIERRGYY